MKIILLGASGFTGQLILRELTSRKLTPMIVGRNRAKLEALAERYGNPPVAVADANERAALSALVNPGDILVSTVGPFNELGYVPLEVAVENGAHYVDSTGEHAFIAEVYRRYQKRLEGSKQLVMTACGYDYVPGQLVGGCLASAFGEQVTDLNIVYTTQAGGIASMTSGTIESFAQAIYEKGTFYRNGELVSDYVGNRTLPIHFHDKTIQGISLAGIEGLELPRLFPSLKSVNVYLGWFGRFGGLVSSFSRVQQRLFKLPGYLATMRKLSRKVSIPHRSPATVIEKGNSDVLVKAEAREAHGEMLGEIELKGHNMYEYTGEIMAWIIAQIEAGKVRHYGVSGPLRAFGLDALAQGHEKIGFNLSEIYKREEQKQQSIPVNQQAGVQ